LCYNIYFIFQNISHIKYLSSKNKFFYFFIRTLSPQPPLRLRLLVYLLLILLRLLVLLAFLDLCDFLCFLEDKNEKRLNDFIIL